MRADFPLDKKTVENQDWVTGLRGCRGPRAARPSGCRVAGPWRAMGREVAGPSRAVGREPLGRGPAFSKTRR